MASRIHEPWVFADQVTFLQSVRLPAGSIADDEVAVGAKVSADKIVHRHLLNYSQKDGTDVVSEAVVLHVAKFAGRLRSVEVRPTTAPSGGDKQYTVDVQKAADGSGTWTSLLNSIVTVDSSAASNTKIAATLVADPSVAAGEALRIVVTTSGTTGTQGQGLCVAIEYDEDPV